MPFLIGFLIVAIIVYFAFLRKETDTDEVAVKKIAQTVVVVAILLIIVLKLTGNSIF